MTKKEDQNENIKLDNQICFKLYFASRLTTKLYKPLLENMDLTYPQYLVMLVLWETDHIQVKSISEKLYLNTNTLTPLLKRLESNGLITRTRSKQDERQMIISLTEHGKALKQESKHIPMDLYHNILDNGDFTPEDFKMISQLLDKIIKAMIQSDDLL